MSTIINYIITNFIASTNYGAVTNGVSIIVVGILLVLLIEKVLLDAYEDKPNGQSSIAFTIIILPLLVVMIVFIILRMAQILKV